MLTFDVSPEKGDMVTLARTMRLVDRQEILASSGEAALTVLRDSWDQSDIRYFFYLDGQPVAALGVVQLTETIGVPWLLCGENVEDIPNAEFWRISKTTIGIFEEDYHVLTNYVDERNLSSRRWLRHLGFSEMETINYGFAKRPFIRFEKTRCVKPQP